MDDGAPRPQGGKEGRATSRQRVAELRERRADLERRAQERLAAEQERWGWVRSVVEAYEADRNRGGALLSGGLAYRIFLWELPAMLFVVNLLGVISSVAGDEPSEVARRAGMAGAVAATIARAVSGGDAARWWLMLFGFVLMVWAARGAVKSLRLISQISWQERAPRTGSMKGALVFSGVVLLAMALPIVLSEVIEGFFLFDILQWVLVTVLYLGLMIFATTWLPRGERPWTAVLPGSVVFVIVLRVVMIASSPYFARRMESVDDLYGAFGIAIVILLWLFLISRLFVAGQFLNATLAGVPSGRLSEGPAATTGGEAAPGEGSG